MKRTTMKMPVTCSHQWSLFLSVHWTHDGILQHCLHLVTRKHNPVVCWRYLNPDLQVDLRFFMNYLDVWLLTPPIKSGSKLRVLVPGSRQRGPSSSAAPLRLLSSADSGGGTAGPRPDTVDTADMLPRLSEVTGRPSTELQAASSSSRATVTSLATRTSCSRISSLVTLVSGVNITHCSVCCLCFVSLFSETTKDVSSQNDVHST